LRTERRDGHAFLGEARAKGASAALVARADPAEPLPQLVVADPLLALQAAAREHRRRFRGPVIGISGSAGKTSTKNLLAELLGGEPRVLATRGNLNNHLGVPLTLLRLDPQDHAYAVVEAGISGPGDMPPLAAMIEPDIGVITLVGPAHLEALGSLAGVAREKAELPRAARMAVFPASCLEYTAFRDLTVPTLKVERVEDPAALRDSAAGLITAPDDPRARLVACPGLPGCRSGHVPAATDALTLADDLPPGLVLHVSGCAKGCAAGRTSHPVVLVGRPLGGYDVVRNGRAQDAPVATLPDLAAARRYLADLTVHA
jgi:hypothetical protein